MSVQLIVYPQVNPNGTYTYTSTANTNEYVGDYGLNGALAGSTTASSASNAIAAATPIINAWKVWTTSGNTMPFFQGGIFSMLATAGSYSKTGLYQLIDSLVPGISYEITITFSSSSNLASGAEIIIGNYTGAQTNVGGSGYNTLGSSIFINYSPTAGTIITETFTANNTTELLMLTYRNDAAVRILIDKISVRETQTVENSIYTDLNDGQVIVDLYEETSIPLTLSVDEFKNAAEKPTSYSKSFSLPATKRNNQIFGNLFDVTRSTKDDLFSFNPYKKTHIILKENGYNIFKGLLKLIDISENAGEVSYNVNLFSKVTSLKELLLHKTLGDIDFSELEHTFTATNIENSWTGDLDLTNPLSLNTYAGTYLATTTSVLKYPLCDWTGNFTINSNGNGFSMETLEDGFRPWLNVKYLVDRILSDAGYFYDSTFLNSDYFTNLYLDFNTGGLTHGGILVVKQGTDNGVHANDNWTAGYTGYTNLKFAENINSEKLKSQYWTNDHTFTATRNNQQISITWGVVLKNHAGSYRSIYIRIRKYNAGGAAAGNVAGSFVAVSIGGNDLFTYSGNASFTLDDGEYLQMQFVSSGNDDDVQQWDENANSLDYWNFYVIDENIDDYKLSNSLRGKMPQWDLMSGIIKMFNLIVTETPPTSGSFSIEPYKDIFQPWTDSNHVEILDWTDKVDAQEFKLTPIPTLKKRHVFTYKKDSKDYVSKEYSEVLGGYLFGTHTREEQDNDFVSGETKIELPFASTIDKPLFGTSQFTSPAIFAKKGEDNFEDFENLPRILHDNGVHAGQWGGDGFSSPIQNHATDRFNNQYYYLQFTHYENPIPSTNIEDKNYNFGLCQTLSNPINIPTETLYHTYWQPYIDDLYDNDTRVLKLKINLYPSDVSGFRFYDMIRIKNRLYRCNNINYRPGDISDIELILL